MNRRAAQLIEEALLLSVALIALTLVVNGVTGILHQATDMTSSIWSNIQNSITNLFSSAFHW